MTGSCMRKHLHSYTITKTISDGTYLYFRAFIRPDFWDNVLNSGYLGKLSLIFLDLRFSSDNRETKI